MDASGRVLRTIHTPITDRVELNVGDLSPGSYLVRVKGDGRMRCERFQRL